MFKMWFGVAEFQRKTQGMPPMQVLSMGYTTPTKRKTAKEGEGRERESQYGQVPKRTKNQTEERKTKEKMITLEEVEAKRVVASLKIFTTIQETKLSLTDKLGILEVVKQEVINAENKVFEKEFESFMDYLKNGKNPRV